MALITFKPNKSRAMVGSSVGLRSNRLVLSHDLCAALGPSWHWCVVQCDRDTATLQLKLVRESDGYLVERVKISRNSKDTRVHCSGYVEQFGLTAEAQGRYLARYDETKRLVVVDLQRRIK